MKPYASVRVNHWRPIELIGSGTVCSFMLIFNIKKIFIIENFERFLAIVELFTSAFLDPWIAFPVKLEINFFAYYIFHIYKDIKPEKL